jgi:hypothetical protein
MSSFAGIYLKDSDTGSPKVFAAARNDIVLPVWMWFGEFDPNSGKHDNTLRAQTFWKHVNGVKVDKETAPGHFGEDADDVVTEGQLATYIYEGTHAEFRATVVKNMPHNVQPISAWRMWDDFLSKYERTPDGKIVLRWYKPPDPL